MIQILGENINHQIPLQNPLDLPFRQYPFDTRPSRILIWSIPVIIFDIIPKKFKLEQHLPRKDFTK